MGSLLRTGKKDPGRLILLPLEPGLGLSAQTTAWGVGAGGGGWPHFWLFSLYFAQASNLQWNALA